MDALGRDGRFRGLQTLFLQETMVALSFWTTRLERSAELSKHEFESLFSIIHNLKGSGGGYGFRPLTDMAARIEAAMVSGIRRADLTKLMTELLWLHRRLCDDFANR